MLPSGVLDPDWLKARLPQCLARDDEPFGEIVDLDIVNRWLGKKRVTLLYRLAIRAENGQVRDQYYSGYVVPTARLDDEYRSIRARGTIPPPIGRSVALLAEANLILLVTPNDRKMTLLSEEHLESWLRENPRAVTAGTAASRGEASTVAMQLEKTRIVTLRYVPDKRVTFHCRATLRQANGSLEDVPFVAKQFGRIEQARAAFQNLTALEAAWLEVAPESTPSSPRIPRALALDESRGVVFIEWCPGRELLDVVSEIDLSKALPAVGALLARLHRAPLSIQKVANRLDEIGEVRRGLQMMARALPTCPVDYSELLETLVSLDWSDEAADVLLHGTYRLNHVLLDGSRLVLLDLDSLRRGHPAYDIANFLSSLYYLEVQNRLTSSTRSEIVRHFLQGYAASSRQRVCAVAVLWFFASLMINKQAVKYVKHLHDRREERVMSMLGIAEQALVNASQIPTGLNLDDVWRWLPQEIPSCQEGKR